MASTLSRLQLGQTRGLRAKLLRRYEHQPLVSCLAGLYGCRWRRYERSCAQPGDCCCNKVSQNPPLDTSGSGSVHLYESCGGVKLIKKSGVCVCVSVRRCLITGAYLAVLFALYLVPLGLYSPCIKEKRTLGPAPALIGHRGAPMLAPENTLMSFEKAVEAGSKGLETDVTISFDGVPFLMHDRTLRRTTNVHEVFPNRTDALAAMFTWAELESLNAGAWFLSHNPFGTTGSLGAEERRQAANQSVCSLQAFLQLAAQTDKLVIFDLYRPPRGHPYRDTWIQRTLEVIQNESSIQSSQVRPATDLRDLVQEIDPELQQTSGSRLPLEELQSNNIVKLNLHYSSMSAELIRSLEYEAVNITTNLYVISQPWLYSLAWCSGVHSVTTNSPQLLSIMSSPMFLMSPDEYNLMWILTDLLSLMLIVIIFVFHRLKKKKNLSSISTLNKVKM
uniref:Glycerophosphodiester phosphodiesterase domain containing 4b n=1 Tax=Echeneis naucrates TaxID=173247 RepID=A0A665TVC8_ECHNA